MKQLRALTALHMSPVTKYVYHVCIALMLIFLIPNNGEGQSKDGFYLGVGMTYNSIGGDFDGVNFVAGGGSVEAMPEIEAALGIKYIAGFQSYIGSIDFHYSRSDHDGTWEGSDTPVVFETYNMDLKAFLLRESYGVRPFLAFGFGLNSLTVEDGSTDGFFVVDATFKGYALRFGGGLEVSLHDRIGIDALAVYRWETYDYVEGIVEGDLPDNIDSNGATYSAEVKFIF